MKNKAKLLITGPIAPPAGGISIHIQRLSYFLQEEFTVDFIDEATNRKEGIFNMWSMNPFGYLRKICWANILFVHSGNKLFKQIHILAGRIFGKKVVITIHSYGKRRKQPFRVLDEMIYRLAHKIILVNADIHEKLSLPKNKCVVMHAFLPPIMEMEPGLPMNVTAWIKQAREKNQVIICANASRLNLYNNQDLYGLDMSIAATKYLLDKGINISFIYIVSALDVGADLFNNGLKQIEDEGMKDRFMLISEKLSFVRLIENADIVIRPSNTDGDALTIRESIYLGKCTIASDVVERPAGTILFKTRDVADLELKMEEEILKLRSGNNISAGNNNATEDYAAFYKNLFRTVTAI